MTHILFQIDDFLKAAKAVGAKAILVVTGPTASGKTSLAIALAQRFNGEIISADSAQIYRKMDIGTNKVGVKERALIPHHLLDILNPDQPFSMADYKRAAEKVIEELLRRGKLPILCGGTGLYINAVTQNYDLPLAPPNPALREQIQNWLEQEGPEGLHRRLQTLDPEAAAQIHPNNLRYVERALEIVLQTKTQKVAATAHPKVTSFSIAVDWPREELYQKINNRVDELLELGLLNEIKSLLAEGYDPKLPAMQAIGYKEYIPYLKGEATLEECKELHKQFTRNYAKRQLTWFRKDLSIHWISPEEAAKIRPINPLK